MNLLMVVLIMVSTSAAFASQSVFCRETTSSGKLKANGGTINMNLEFNQDGTLSAVRNSIKVIGFTKNPHDLALDSLKLRSADQSKKNADRAYTILFIENDSDLPLDIQLQFNSRILKKNFSSEPGTFVIGSEDANPETGFSFGSPVVCRSRVK